MITSECVSLNKAIAGCNCDGLLMCSLSRSKPMYVFNQTGHDYFMQIALDDCMLSLGNISR